MSPQLVVLGSAMSRRSEQLPVPCPALLHPLHSSLPAQSWTCIHSFCLGWLPQLTPFISDWGHWVWGCSPGPAKQEMTLNDVRNIKLPQKGPISKAHTGLWASCWVSSPAPPRCSAGSCRWGRHLPHTPRTFPGFLTIILAEKLIRPMEALETPVHWHRKAAITPAHTPDSTAHLSELAGKSSSPFKQENCCFFPFLSTPSASRAAFEPH